MKVTATLVVTMLVAITDTTVTAQVLTDPSGLKRSRPLTQREQPSYPKEIYAAATSNGVFYSWLPEGRSEIIGNGKKLLVGAKMTVGVLQPRHYRIVAVSSNSVTLAYETTMDRKTIRLVLR